MKAANGGKVDKKQFINIFSCRSHQHLAKVAVECETISQGIDLFTVIKKSFKESSETGNACNMTLYYSCRRYELFNDLVISSLFVTFKQNSWQKR